MNKPNKKQLEDLAGQIKQDQTKDASAEKRVKVKATFKNAIRKMGQTPPPEKKAK
jgi:hypothetical protein